MKKSIFTIGILLLAAAFLPCRATLSHNTGNAKHVTYEQFGAAGDGVHDDLEAIVAAHEAANARKLPVKAKDGATYYIGKGSAVASIKTPVDWGTARIIIDDRETEDHRKPVFVVESFQEPFDVKGLGTIKAGQDNLGVGFPSRCLVELTNNNHKVYIREGLNQNNGTGQTEVVVVDKQGNVGEKCPVIWDYDEITSAKAYPIDEETLTIRGGIFTTIANQAASEYQYRSRNIEISRSNVRAENIRHFVEGELDHGAPYRGFLYVDMAADVVISNCLFTAHYTYSTIGSAGKPVSMGSYDTGCYKAVNVLYEHCRQTNDLDDTRYWGVFASNFSKDLRMDDVHFSRFDAHMGVANVTLTNSVFGHMAVRMVGFGTIYVENCEVHAPSFLALREDYGSSWDGDIIIKDSKLVTVNPKWNPTILSGRNSGKHDFGYDCCMPRRITVQGFEIDDRSKTNADYAGPAIFSGWGRDVIAAGLLPYPVTEEVNISGLVIRSGRKLRVSDNREMFKNVKVTGAGL